MKKTNLSQKELHLFGELILERIIQDYSCLIEDPDNCWVIDENLELFKKIMVLVIKNENKN